MIDEFDYESPFGWIGVLADQLFLRDYVRSLLQKRNLLIKQTAEGDNVPGTSGIIDGQI